jgi:two-component system CheB/CheR fusion protein
MILAESNSKRSEKEVFPIAGIGASAGGLEAFKQLLENLPLNTGMAFVFIQHLDPKHESALTGILSKATALPVNEVKDRMIVEPDRVYIIPPNVSLTVLNGVFNLEPRKDTVKQHMSIDSFLESLAKDRGSAAIGVILSGTGSDGSQGLEAIKAAGGLTFVQTPQSAKFDGMPHNAIAACAVDFVLPPGEIAGELAKTASSRTFPQKADSDLFSDCPEELNRIFVLLQNTSGINFAEYKQLTVKRRILRRMGLYNMEKLGDYVAFLLQNPAEVKALQQDLLINVTNFFRDPEAFETLKELVFPALIKNRRSAQPIRIWVPGCSTGEEAYSITMSLLDFLEDKAVHIPVQIFATDINETLIEKARSGLYPENIKDHIAPDYLRRFFVEVDKGYQISKRVRDLCIFARQDMAKDPPFSRVDLISCRNVIIYLGSALQKKMFPIFHYALQRNGFLFLGTSESVGEFADLFALVDKKYKIYAKKDAPTPLVYDYAVREYALALAGVEQKNAHSGPVPDGLVFDVQKAADRIVLNQYAPAGVIVNSALEVIQFRGRTGPFLEPAAGPPSFNLLKMAGEGLLFGLRSAINQAWKENQPVKKKDLQVMSDGQSRKVDVQVIPIEGPFPQERYFLVLFEEVGRQAFPEEKDTGGKGTGGEQEEQQEENYETVKLKQELAATKEYLQSIIEQYESANEELRSANEEIQSSNEELQSMNEELETAKEELQSANEELTTLNEELQNRNLELSTANSDVQNLFRSINVPIVMVSRDLHIRNFNAVAEKLLNLIPSDVGRPISNINPNIIVPDLEQIMLTVLDTLNSIEQEVQDRWGHNYCMQVRPYKNEENKIDGLVLTFVDIDPIKKLAASQEYAEAIVETVREPLLVLDAGLRLKKANRAFYQTFQATPAETKNKIIFELGNGQWDIPLLRTLLEDILPRNTSFQDFKVDYECPRAGRRQMLINARRILGLKEDLILMAIEDITAHSDEKRPAEPPLDE